jgi:predicted glycoside hydrolase/deacetylase ChbG (UPF0249 family)
VNALIETLAGLEWGCTELGCHPGYAADLDSMYRSERATEIETLCDPRIRSALAANGIELRSFGELAPSGNGGVQ